MNNNLYIEIIQAKNGSLIPVCKSGKTIDSKYNPEHNAEQILSTVKKDADFYLVLGAGSGIFINKLKQLNEKAKIAVIEYSQEDIDFLKRNLPEIDKLAKIIDIIPISTVEEYLINNYIPAIHGDIEVVTQNQWLSEISECKNVLFQSIQNSINYISADFSAQAHFGKIWYTNIQKNLKLISKNTVNSIPSTIYSKINRKAAVIAAGPSLDETINRIKHNQNEYVIFSTDTAFPVLIKNKIIPDAVVSIDGQYLSHNHFYKFTEQDTVFFLDITGNSSAANKIYKESKPIYFFSSNHPFCQFINSIENNVLPVITSGNGTVTIAAFDLAAKLGFKEIDVYGADFSFSKGKSYTKSTYLENLYLSAALKLNSLEFQYDKLMFRTELIQKENKLTTTVLNSYKVSFEKYLANYNFSFEYKNDIYTCKTEKNYKQYFPEQKININHINECVKKLNDSNMNIINLPLIAYLRKKNPELKTEELVKLARNIVVSYN